jgi:hypothetical protein
MSLLTDGNPNDTEMLRVYEASILSVAHVEAIDLDAKLELATAELSQEVVDILLDHDTPAHLGFGRRRTLGVSDVVVTPSLQRWHALHCLAIVYRDAYNNQLNDRYRAKWQEYKELRTEAKEQAIRFGIGLVSVPIPKASAPSFGVVPSLDPATTYYVSVNWVVANGEEGSASDVTTYTTAEGSLMVVRAVNAPANVNAWNVFVGTADGSLMQQNAAPLPIGHAFTLPLVGLVPGRRPSEGQTPEFYITGGRLLRRG